MDTPKIEKPDEKETPKKFPMKLLFLSIIFACLVELIFLRSESLFYQFVILNYKEFCINFLDKIPAIVSRIFLIGLSIFWCISWWFAFNSKHEKRWIAVLCLLPFLIGIFGVHLMFEISFFYCTLAMIALLCLIFVGLIAIGVPLLF